MRPESFPRLSLLAACLAVPAAPSLSCAATLYWDGTSTGLDADGGSGTWDATSTNWDTAANGGADSAWIDGSDVVFGGVGGTVKMVLLAKPRSLTFQSPGYVLTGDRLEFQIPTIIATGPHDVSITSRLSGISSVTVTKTGIGTLTLSDQNGSNFTFRSNFHVQEGVLKLLGTQGGLGDSGSVPINTTVSAGAMVDLNGCNPLNEGFGIAGAGVGGAGAIVNNHAYTVGGTGSVYLTAPATIGGVSRWGIPSGKVLGMGGHTLTKVGTNEIRLAGAIITPGSIDIKAGSLWFDLGSSTTFAGDSSNNVTVRSGAMLGMTSDGTSAWAASFEPNTTWRSTVGIVGNASSPKWVGPVNLAGATTVDVRYSANLSLEAAAVISGPGSITKTGVGGTLSIASVSTYTGGTNVDGGTILLRGRDLQSGAGAIRGPVVLNTGTTLRLATDQVLGTAPGARVSPLHATGALVESTATGANTLHVVKLSASTIRSTQGGNSMDATGYFQMAAGGGLIDVRPSSAPSVISGRLDLGAGPEPTTFAVAEGPASDDLSVNASITGSTPGQGMTKSGSGRMLLGSPATFTGLTTVEEGGLLLGRDGTLPSSPVTVKGYGAFGTDHPGKSLAALTVEAHGQILLPAKAGSTTVINGPLHFPEGNFFVSPVLGAGATTGVIDLATADSITGSGLPVLAMDGAYGPNRATGTIAVNGNKLQLTLTSTGGELVWNNDSAAGSRSGIWDTNLENFSLSGASTAFQSFDRVTFNDSVAPGENKYVSVTQTIAPALITVDNSNGDYDFGNTGNLTGVGSLLKTGSATLSIGATGGYPLTGDITAAGGVIQFHGRTILIDKLTLSGGALDGAIVAFKSADFQSGSSSATLTGASPWMKTTSGKAILTGNNLLTGPGIVAEGILYVNAAVSRYTGYSSPGSLGSSQVHIAADAAVCVAIHDNDSVVPNTFSGTGSLTLAGSNTGRFPYSDSRCRLTGDYSGFQGTIDLVSATLTPAPATLGNVRVRLGGNAHLNISSQIFANAVEFVNTAPDVSTLDLLNSTQTGPVSLPKGGTARITTYSTGTISGPIQDSGGPGSVTFEGAYPRDTFSTENKLTLSGVSTYTGPTTVTEEGVLNLTGSLGDTAVTVTSKGTIGGNGSIGTGGSLTFQQDGRLWVKSTGDTLTVNGDVDLGTRTRVVVDLSTTPPRGPFPVLRYAGTLTGGTAEMATEVSVPYRQAVFGFSPGLITLDIGSKSVIWKGQSHTRWEPGSAPNWSTDGTAEAESYYDGDDVTFDDTGVTQSVTGQNLSVRPASTLFDNSTKDYNIGVPILGAGKITKRGTGIVNLSLGSGHTGGTFIEAGTLQANFLGTGPVHVSAGATLMGAPTIGLFNCAGTLDPGIPGGTGASFTSGPAVFSGVYQCLLDSYYASNHRNCDLFTVKGDLDLTGSTLAITKLPPTSGPVEVYTILTYTGNLTGDFACVTGMPEDYKLVHDVANKSFIIIHKPFSEWIDTFANLSDRAPGGDPDGDGISNIAEYVLGGNPGVGDTLINPSYELTKDYLVFRYKRRDSSIYNTTQVVQWSTDMMTWNDRVVSARGSSPVFITLNGELPDDVSVYINRPPGQKIFARLKVTPK